MIDGDRLTITFDEEINSTVPKANNFKVKIGRKNSKVEAVTVDQNSNSVILTLKNAALVTDVVTLDYKTKKKDQEKDVLEDLSGNDLQSIKGMEVTNNTFVDPDLDLIFPTIESAEINGAVLTIALDEDIASTVPKASNFKVKIGRKNSKVESVTVDQNSNSVFLTLKNAALVTDVVTLDYKTKKKDQDKDVLEDLSGNDLQSIKGMDVTNNTFVDPDLDLTFPTIESAEINGAVLTIAFDEDINSTVPKSNNFKVKIGRKNSKVEAVTVDQDSDSVNLSLKNAALVTDIVTLDYKTKKKDQDNDVIEDLSGNDLQSIKGVDVTNVTVPDAITGLSSNASSLSMTAASSNEVVVEGDVLLEVNRTLGLAANSDDDGSLFFSETASFDGLQIIPPISDALA